MPIYDYQCSDCGKTYDVLHKVREIKEDVVCPSCNSTEHVRLISAPSISMKGSARHASESAPSCNDGSCCAGSCSVN
jgi:putative FmdB family regulatory protein